MKALDWLLNVIGRDLERKAQPAKIRAYLQQLGMRPAILPGSNETHIVRVAAVQEQIAVLKTWQAYARRMHAFVRQAVEQGAQLVCFPEENGTLLLGQIPLIDLILKFASRRLLESETKPGPETNRADILAPGEKSGIPAGRPLAQDGGLSVPHLLAFFTPFIKSTFEAVFSELARGYGVYIMAGSTMLVENGQLFNRAYLFDPNGRLVGMQDKVHPIELEMAMGLTCGTELKVFDTHLGRLAFPVCMDATYFETFKILKHLGAQIVIIPIANQEDYDPNFALRGIWPRVQESGIYGLKSALVGDLYGIHFTGKAGVFAPLELTPDHSGVIAEARTFDQDEVVVADLDLSKLDGFASVYAGDSNPALYRKYFPDLYG
jgi:predicted amidohydrolase